MAVTRTKVDVSEERRILAHMITSTPLLLRLKGIGEARLFESAFARIAATWCWEYQAVTGEAPGRGLEDIYHRKAKEMEEEDRELLSSFLSSLSADWERATHNNVDYAFDTALQYFKIQALKRLRDQLEGAISDQNPAQGEKLIGEYIRPERVAGQSVDMFREFAPIIDAFHSEDEALFRFPGALGQVMGNFVREDFVAFLAPPKRGKTWWLMAVAMMAAMSGLKVMFVSLEMSQRQMVRRFWQMLSGQSRYGEEVPWSTFARDGEKWVIETGPRATPQVQTEQGSIQKLQQHIRRNSRGGELRLENYPTGGLSVAELKTRVSNLSLYENLDLDVLVLDYADIMDHGGGTEERHKLNRTWMALRGMASEYKLGLFTASQSSGREQLTGKKDANESNIAEDYRKLAHVTKMVTINQNKEEKARGIYRLSCNTAREEATINDEVIVTGCLAIGRPWTDSRLGSSVDDGGAH